MASPSTTANEPGPQLLASGCRQGCFLDLAARPAWLTRSAGGWELASEVLEGAGLVIISQDCDVFAALKSEPRVEAIAARWTDDRTTIHTARKGNSSRLFLLREQGKEALVADIRYRVAVDKQALLGQSFETIFQDERARMRFSNWVARRYNRPAIPNDLVEAVQKPVVRAVGQLARKGDAPFETLERIAEIRFAVSGERPWIVDLFFLIEPGEAIDAEEEAEVAGWIDGVLAGGGAVSTTRPFFLTETSISLHDYLSTTQLQLDHFSPEDEPA